MDNVINTPRVTLKFELTRKTGKSISLAKGNQMISSNDRMYHMTKSTITQYLRELGATELETKYEIQEPIFTPTNPCYIRVTVCPPTKRRMDAPNWYPTVKALVDGLTDGDLFSDDNDDVIKLMSFQRGPITTDKKYHLILDIYHSEAGDIYA